MPDSSLHSLTHLDIFCTMSIWFLLPFNLPVPDWERNTGHHQRKEAGVMKKTEGKKLNADLIRAYNGKCIIAMKSY